MTTLAQIALMGVIVTAFFSLELWAAVWAIRRREPISVIAEMHATIADMAAQARVSAAQQEDSHRRVLKLESIVAELDQGLKTLLRQLERLNETPDYNRVAPLVEVLSSAASAALAAGERGTIQRKMARNFTMGELESMALALDMDESKLKGDTTNDRAGSMIRYMDTRQQLDQLIALCVKERPRESWLAIE